MTVELFTRCMHSSKQVARVSRTCRRGVADVSRSRHEHQCLCLFLCDFSRDSARLVITISRFCKVGHHYHRILDGSASNDACGAAVNLTGGVLPHPGNNIFASACAFGYKRSGELELWVRGVSRRGVTHDCPRFVRYADFACGCGQRRRCRLAASWRPFVS